MNKNRWKVHRWTHSLGPINCTPHTPTHFPNTKYQDPTNKSDASVSCYHQFEVSTLRNKQKKPHSSLLLTLLHFSLQTVLSTHYYTLASSSATQNTKLWHQHYDILLQLTVRLDSAAHMNGKWVPNRRTIGSLWQWWHLRLMMHHGQLMPMVTHINTGSICSSINGSRFTELMCGADQCRYNSTP